MTTDQRTVLRDRYEAGETIAQIAASLGVSERTARKELLLAETTMRPRGSIPGPRKPRDRPVSHDLALAVTDYRLAVEQATALLRMGRVPLALAVLETVASPMR